jgi:2-dehydro-3-deoxyphosphogluconate aldolase / (4S)-4-hydroxy-2-oxoglutarate aldolase
MIAELADVRTIAILRSRSPAEHTLRASRAIARAGVRHIEITLTSPGALEVIAALARDTQAIIGAGTVTTPELLDSVVDAGARFIVTPVVTLPVVARARARNIPVICGCSTPTELWTAHQAGADLLKVYPAQHLGGPEYIRTILQPLEGLKLVPTGGVQVEDVAAYLRAGAFAVGVGDTAFDVTLPDDELAHRARAIALMAASAGRP